MTNILHGDSTARSLALCRIVIFSSMCQCILANPFTRLDGMPLEWFVPRGPFQLLPDAFFQFMFQPSSLLALKACALVLGVPAILGARFYHVWAGLFSLSFLLIHALSKGFYVAVDHSHLSLMFCSWILCLFPAADAFSWQAGKKGGEERSRLYAGAMVSMVLGVCLFYFILGLRRFVLGGLDIFINDTILSYFARRAYSYSVSNHQYGLLALTYPAVGLAMKMGYFLVTLCEVLSPLCLFFRRFRWIWVGIMLTFHVMTIYTMNINYKYNIVLIILLFTPLVPWLLSREKAGFFRKPRRQAEESPAIADPL